MKAAATPGGTVLRASSSMVAFVAVSALAALFVVDAAVRGRAVLALQVGLWAAVVVWVAWMFLVRMSVRLGAHTVLVRNLGRFTRVPWSRVVEVRRRAQLQLVLDDGTILECWGSPFPPRRRADEALDSMRAAWQAAPAGDDPTERGWDLPALFLGAILLVVAVVATLW